jgi:hypothetical protein
VEGTIAPITHWILSSLGLALLHLAVETAFSNLSKLWSKIMNPSPSPQRPLRTFAGFAKKLMLHTVTAAIVAL